MKYISCCLFQSLFNGSMFRILNAVQSYQIKGEIDAETRWTLAEHQVLEFTFAYKCS